MNQLELEARTISAACRMSPNATALAVADSCVKSEDFSDSTHRALWGTVMGFVVRGQKVTDIELLEASKGLNVGAVIGVLRTAPEFGLAQLLERLREAGKARRAHAQLAKALSVLEGGATVKEAHGALLEAMKAIGEEDTGIRTSERKCIEIVDDIEANANGTRVPVIATGLERWDVALGGLQPTLTVIGAMPGVGKSALLAALVRNLAGSGVKVGFFSLEDEGKWIASRLLSFFSRVPLQTLLFRRLDKSQFEDVQAGMNQVHAIMANTVIDDRQGVDCRDVVAQADAMVAAGCKAIFVDHLGEIRIKSRERHDLEITEVCSDLRGIAKRHGVPVVLACHLKRNGNETEASEPRLTDFAFSSGIERTCRVGLGLSRPVGENGKPIEGVMRVHILKQTNGASRDAFDLEIDQQSAVVRSATASPRFAETIAKHYPRRTP